MKFEMNDIKSKMNTITEDRWSISDIVKCYKPDGSGDISLPPSQRLWAWKNKRGEIKKRNLIDSVMNRFPIPTCILHRISKHQFHIYDGRHRIETFYLYANDEFTWNSKKFSELTDHEKFMFNSREIPVTIIGNVTVAQLADIFIRLNAGIPLKDYDLLWANRDSPLVRAVEKFIRNNERLSNCLGGYDMTKREDLSNWTALICGLSTQNAGNMTTAYIRVCSDVGLDHPPNEKNIVEGLDAICTLLETANTLYPTDTKGKRSLKTCGRLIAFFVGDWLNSENKSETINKWVNVIGKLRNNDEGMKVALVTIGAQNLTTTKITKTIDQVNKYLEDNIVEATAEESDYESE
jgi:hypothetical protein